MLSTAAPEFRGLRFKLLGLALCAIGLLFAAASTAVARNEGSLVETESARLEVWTGPAKPSFTLTDADGRDVRLDPSSSAITVVHFFATWCEPCRAELPALDRLIARSDPSGLRVIVVSVAEFEGRIRSFLEKNPVKLQILLDRDRGVARSWQVHSLPTTFILGRDFRPRLFIEREYDWDSFDLTSVTRAIASEKRAGERAMPTTPNFMTTDLKGEQR